MACSRSSIGRGSSARRGPQHAPPDTRNKTPQSMIGDRMPWMRPEKLPVVSRIRIVPTSFVAEPGQVGADQPGQRRTRTAERRNRTEMNELERVRHVVAKVESRGLPSPQVIFGKNSQPPSPPNRLRPPPSIKGSCGGKTADVAKPSRLLRHNRRRGRKRKKENAAARFPGGRVSVLRARRGCLREKVSGAPQPKRTAQRRRVRRRSGICPRPCAG